LLPTRLFLAVAWCAAVFSGAASAADITVDTVKAALPRLDAIVEDALRRTGVPGVAVAVVLGDEILYLKGYGVRLAGETDPVDADTIFQLASVSKPLASTAIASVVGTGEVTWDSKIADIDPDFRLHDAWPTSQVTIRDMFSHRTGLPKQAGDLLEDLGYDRDEILQRLRYLEPVSSFRSTYAYTNFLLTEAAVATARAAGRTWEELIKERVFIPLGMTRTSPNAADFYGDANRATLHVIEQGSATPRFKRNPDAQSPAGGVSSTVRDLANWLILQLNDGKFGGRQIIDSTALAETHRPQIVRGDFQGRPVFYGLGWNVDYTVGGEVRVGHAGAFFTGARTQVMLIPEHKLGIVVLTNAFPSGVPEAVTYGFLDIVLRGEPAEDYLPTFEKIFALASTPPIYDAPPSASPALPVSAYAGRYSNAYYGDAEVIDEGGRLTLLLGPGRRSFPLDHLDRDTFLFDFTGLGDEGQHQARISFFSADGATADALTIDFLNASGQGTFTRSAAD